MKTLILATACTAAVALSGCASLLGAGLPAAAKAPLTEQFMAQYGERCKTHVWGSVGLGGSSGFNINCEPPQAARLSDTEALRRIAAEAAAQAAEAAVLKALDDFTAPPPQ